MAADKTLMGESYNRMTDLIIQGMNLAGSDVPQYYMLLRARSLTSKSKTYLNIAMGWFDIV